MTMPVPRVRSVILAVGLSAAVLAPALLALARAPIRGAPAADAENSASRARITKAFGKLPLYFIENRGQLDSRVAFYVQGGDTSVFFTSRGVTFALTGHEARREGAAAASDEAFRQPATKQRHALRLDFVGADPAVRPTGTSPTPAVVSYFRGAPDQWQSGLSTYASLLYRELWPGIDLVYSGTGNQLKYTFVLQPWADANRIRLAYQGGTGARLNDAGELEIATPVGRFRDQKPYAYQEIDGKRVEVSARYSLGGSGQSTSTRHEYGFRLGKYDRSKPLVLDPAVLVYAGYIGGAGEERGLGIAVDSVGNAYVAGQTLSSQGTFPTEVGPDLTFNGNLDGYVAKINAAGTALIYAGYIGGAGHDAIFDIALDSGGNAYVTGFTTSNQTTFPVTIGPDLTFNGSEDAFVAKVNVAGTELLYAGYIGGRRTDFGEGIAIDSDGNAYVSGTTASQQATFPVTLGPDLTYNGGAFDAFVAKVDAQGSGLVYAGYIGGARSDAPASRDGRELFVSGGHIAVDGVGNAYVSGTTESNEHTFPNGRGFGTIPGPDKTHNGSTDAFIVKVRADGLGLAYAGYIGGAGDDTGVGMAVDSAGNAYMTGDTNSTAATFPVILGPDLTYNGGLDCFVAKVRSDGTGLVYSGYIGGSDDEQGLGVAIQETEGGTFLYVTGHTRSTEATFPVIDGPDLTFNGALDAFVAKLKPVPNELSVEANFVYNGYIGGAGEDAAFWLAVDSAGSAYVTGDTESTEASFPDGSGFGALPGPDQTFNGAIDAFVVRVDGGSVLPPPPHDDFANAIPIASLPFSDSRSTTTATTEPGEPSCGGFGKSVWYSFTPSADVSITANTFGSDFDTVLAAYTGTSLSSLTLVACNDEAADTNQSRITFVARAGTTIFLQVSGFHADSGNLTINVAEAPLPSNDNFADASPITSLPFTSTLRTDAATSEADEPSPCGSIGNTIWYSFTAGADVTLTATTFGSDYDTVLAAYTGTSLSDLTLVACNDQPAFMKQSRITFAAQAGTTYFFQVGGNAADTGNLTFNVAVAPVPPNDNFADAAPIGSLPFTSSLSTDAATSETDEPSPCGSIGKTVWYSFTADADISITANTFGSDYDTVLAAYTGTSLSDLTLVACNDQTVGGNLSRIGFAATAGTTVFIQAGGFQANSGNLTINVAESLSSADNFANAITVTSLPFTETRSTVDASTEPDEPAPCGAIANSVWYSFTPGADVTLTVDTVGSNFDTVLAAYTGTSLSNLKAIACTTSAGTIQSVLSIAVPAGTTIFFQAGSLFGASGNLTFNLAPAAGTPPPNDRFANATPVASLPFTVSLSTASATSEPGEPSACGGIAHTVWYSYTPGANVSITANTFGSDYDTVVAAYSGTSLSNLTPIDCTLGGGGQAQISFAAAAGTTIYFQVGGFFGGIGNLTFSLTEGQMLKGSAR